ncbi:MAG TPA: DJ-1/PfpI family protein [Gemmatimonadaceae bacterium]
MSARHAVLVSLGLVALATMPRGEAPRDTRPVVAIVADAAGTELTDFMIPRATLASSGIAQVVTVAPRLGRISLPPSQISIEPDQTMAAFDAAHPTGADYVVVPALVDRANPAVLAWLRKQAAHGATIVAICEGSWTVAATGLLDGKSATSHWHALEKLEKKYPRTTWVRDRRYVVDDHLITSTGVTAALPVSLVMIERIAGRRVADSIAASIGIPAWDATHETAAFRVTKGMYVKAIANQLAWWRHDEIAVPVADGVDEIALALTLDAIPRTIRGKAFTWSADGAPVVGRQGLRISVDWPRAVVPSDARELRLPSASAPSASALDSALVRLTRWYGRDAAELITMGMEYRGQ